jgi:hypothetical protein
MTFFQVRRFYSVVLLCLLFLFFYNGQVGAQDKTNLNRYYRFPLSVGVEYQGYTPFGQYGSQYNIFELGGVIRWPIPPLPLLQPIVKAGMISFDSQDQEEPYKWDHFHWFAGGGLVVSYRFAKNFEIGGEIAASFTQSVFENLSPDGPVGAQNIIAEAGLRLGLNPSYNFSVDVHPSIKYFHSFSPLTDYNGFIFGIGFSGHFRFGRDPDSPQAIIRNIRFEKVEVPPVFAAMQSYYVKNPVGKVSVTNTEKQSIRDVSVSFFQNGYMDSPTLSAALSEIKGGETVTIPLLASFNSEVFSTEGITPLTGEVIITYTSGGRAAKQNQSVSYDLHDKTALTWDDDRKVAAFITPADSALRNYTSFIRQACKEATVPGFSNRLQEAMQIYNALTLIGCLYQVDPRSPFTEVQENPMVVDSISLPRDTLKRITGDCDDLTVLYCSLAETVGIESGFITIPGHIFAVFNTGVDAREFEQVHPDRSMTVPIDGSLWVPVEITMIGKEGFLEAWRKGVEEYRIFDKEPEKRGFYITREAQREYRPVGLKETDLGLQYGDPAQLTRLFGEDMGKLIDQTLTPFSEAADRQGGPKEYNKLGIMQAKFRQYEEAEASFRKALSRNSGYLSARINLANVQFLQDRFGDALGQFLTTLGELTSAGKDGTGTALKLLLNISKAYYALEEYSQAEEYYRQAEAIDADTVAEYSYLASVSAGSEEGRASEAADKTEEILFIEEDEE